MSKQKKPPSQKVILQMDCLPEPWVAVQHRGHENQIYYYNKHTKEALWTGDFNRKYGHLKERANSGRDQRRSKEHPVAEESFHGEEPMDLDIDYELKEFRSQGNHLQAQESFSFPSLSESVDQMQPIPSDSSVVAVLDTSALVHTENFVRKTGAAGVHIRIPYTTLRELDGLKKSDRLRSAVNAALRQMEILKNEQPDLISYESSADKASELQLRASSGEMTVFQAIVHDDFIIKTALQARRLVTREQRVVLVSNDYNMRVRANADELTAVSSTEFISSLLASPKPRKEVIALAERKKDKKALAPPHVNFKRAPAALNQTHPPAPVQEKTKKKKKKPSAKTTICPPVAPTDTTCYPHLADLVPAAVPQPRPTQHRSPPPQSPVPSVVSPRRRQRPVPAEIADQDRPCWFFDSEVKRFAFILKTSTDAALERLKQKAEDWERVKEAMTQLGRLYIEFIAVPNLQNFREAIQLTLQLYSAIFGRMMTLQRMNVEKLEDEVDKKGTDGEAFVVMQQYVDRLKSNGWEPSC